MMNERMKISVVMATYNGEKYIHEQLESILSQTRKPDEVLIFDDQSSDGTVGIISAFIAKEHLEENWHVVKNQVNKGHILNFLQGVSEAAGDIIFYSDQDDIWEAEKLEKMERGFVEYPDMQACYCLRNYIDAAGNPKRVKYQFMTNVWMRTKGFQKVSVKEAVKFNKSSGLCLAIRKSLVLETRDMILEAGLTHDLPIGTVAAIKDGYYVLNQKLVRYRLHENNISSPRVTVQSRINRIEEQIEGRKIRLRQMVAIYERYSGKMQMSDRLNFAEAIRQTEKSIDLLKSGDTAGLFFMMFRRNPMINGWISINNWLTSLRNKS